MIFLKFFCESNDLEEHLEEPVADPEPDPEPEPEQEPVSEIQEEKCEPVLEETAPEDAQKSSSPAPTDIAQTAQEDLRVCSMSLFLPSFSFTFKSLFSFVMPG